VQSRVWGRQVVVEPGRRALGKILEEAGPREDVMLTGVDDELCRYPQCPQRLIHLLAADDRNIEVLVSAQEERWRANAVRMEEWIRHLEPQRRIAPRRAKFIVVLENVFV